MGFVHFRQQTNVSSGVQTREAAPVVGLFFDASLVQVLPDQSRHLCTAQARHLSEIASQQPFFFFQQDVILLADQGLPYPVVDLLSILPYKINLLTCRQKCSDLIQASGRGPKASSACFPPC